jgi:hypothetical protein
MDIFGFQLLEVEISERQNGEGTEVDPIPLRMLRISRDHIIKIKILVDQLLSCPKISEHQEIKLVWPKLEFKQCYLISLNSQMFLIDIKRNSNQLHAW